MRAPARVERRHASKQRCARLVELLGGLYVAERAGQLVQLFERDALAQELRRIGQA